MAGVRDSQLYKAGPWPLGVNNTAEEGALPQNEYGTRAVALREAVNVDLTAQGRPRRRRGYESVLAGALVHSLWSHEGAQHGFFVAAGELYAAPTTMDEALPLGVSVGGLDLSYALINERVYFSNSAVSGLITPDLQAWSWAPECPTGQPTVTPVAGYSLDKGVYQVAVTFTDLLGRESGTGLAAQVDVEQGGGIELGDIPAPLDPVATPTVNIYVTGANDQVFRLYASVPSATVYGVVSAPADGRVLLTQHLQALPAGHIVRGGHGRQWVARGAQVLWSQPLRYGLFNPARDRMRFHARVDMVEPLGDGDAGAGVFVAAGEKLYWYQGADPGEFRQTVAAHHGVVPGSPTAIAADAFGLDSTEPAVAWLGTDGTYYLGTAGGKVTALTSGVAVDSADRAATLYREQGGMQQFIAALLGPKKQAMAVTDRAYAHVVHRDAGLP